MNHRLLLSLALVLFGVSVYKLSNWPDDEPTKPHMLDGTADGTQRKMVGDDEISRKFIDAQGMHEMFNISLDDERGWVGNWGVWSYAAYAGVLTRKTLDDKWHVRSVTGRTGALVDAAKLHEPLTDAEIEEFGVKPESVRWLRDMTDLVDSGAEG